MLQMNFLGQVQLRLENGTRVDLSSDKWAALLAYLSVTNEAFARPQLEALLWPDAPPEKAQTSLRTAVYNINKQLDAPLKTTRKMVSLAAERPFAIDVLTFQALVAQADVAAWQEAVDLYRGEFLAGLIVVDAPDFEMWLLQERERLRLALLTTLHRLLAHYWQCGEMAAAIRTARRLLAVEPWREEVQRQLMLLLARSGDYNGALKQYQQCRQLLADELGVAPMPETEALYARIMALRERPPKLYLPASLPSLVGREVELTTLISMLADEACRLVAITGGGGIGKTSLAMTLAKRQSRHFLDGVFFVPLAHVTTAVLLDMAVVGAVGVTVPPQAEPRDYLCQQLQARECLLVLDNAEHLLSDVEALVSALLLAAPEVKIVLTSRERPRLRAATVVALTGLALPTATADTAVVPTAAITLFEQEARRVKHDFVLAEVWSQVVALCRLLEGFPLGIVLAAAQLDRTDCRQLVASLTQDAVALAVDYQDMPLRHRSLLLLFDHSWQLLSPDERSALAKLAVFRGGFTLEAAVAVGQFSRQLLTHLVAKSFLQQQDGRFYMHAFIRQCAERQLGGETAVYDQHAHYFAQQLQRFAIERETKATALVAELDNVRAMWDYAIRQQAVPVLTEAIHGLARLYAITNRFAEGDILFAQAVTALSATTLSATPLAEAAPQVWGQLLGRYAMFLFRVGQLREAATQVAASVSALQPTTDDEALAFSLNLLGIIHIHQGDFETAVAYLRDCAELYRGLDDPALLLKPLINLGSVQMRLGNYSEAIAYLSEALPLARTHGDERGVAHILNNLGANYLILGDFVEAKAHLTACLPLTEAIAYQSIRMVVYQNLAEVACKQGEWAQAESHCEASLAIALEIDDQVNRIRTQRLLALAVYALGRRVQAWQILQEAASIGYEIEAWAALMDVLTGVGRVLLQEGETAVAVAILRFVQGHSATEEQYVQEAGELLAEVEGGEVIPAEKTLPALMAWIAGWEIVDFV